MVPQADHLKHIEENLGTPKQSNQTPLPEQHAQPFQSNQMEQPSLPINSTIFNDPKLEKRRQNIEVIKWLIGSVVLVIMSTIVNYRLKDRDSSLTEVKEYNKYATDLIILNDNPVKRRRLAQFFSKVIPSEKMREGWQEYYEEVNKEYKNFIRKDSVARVELAVLNNKDNLNNKEKAKKDSLQNFVHENTIIKKSEIEIPTASQTNLKEIAPKNSRNAYRWESEGFGHLLKNNVDAAIQAFDNAEAAYPQFHQVYEISRLLKENRTELNKGNPEYWKQIKTKIATQYNWRMPTLIREKLLLE